MPLREPVRVRVRVFITQPHKSSSVTVHEPTFENPSSGHPDRDFISVHGNATLKTTHTLPALHLQKAVPGHATRKRRLQKDGNPYLHQSILLWYLQPSTVPKQSSYLVCAGPDACTVPISQSDECYKRRRTMACRLHLPTVAPPSPVPSSPVLDCRLSRPTVGMVHATHNWCELAWATRSSWPEGLVQRTVGELYATARLSCAHHDPGKGRSPCL
jgi:hypothetical protein